MRWWSRGDRVFLDMCIYFLIMVLLTKSLYLSFIMFNIIYKIRFSCLASFLLCVPLYGAQNFVDVGDEKEGAQLEALGPRDDPVAEVVREGAPEDRCGDRQRGVKHGEGVPGRQRRSHLLLPHLVRLEQGIDYLLGHQIKLGRHANLPIRIN